MIRGAADGVTAQPRVGADSADDTPMESTALTSTTPSIKKWPISETFRRLKTIYWITGGWVARLSTSLPHRDTHGPLLTCPAQSGQPQNRRLRRFDAARGEDDVEAGARRAEEDPARRLDELGRRRAQRTIKAGPASFRVRSPDAAARLLDKTHGDGWGEPAAGKAFPFMIRHHASPDQAL